MSFRIHEASPADAVEEAFFRIQREQMADVPILNPALSVEAVDFQRWQGHWLGSVEMELGEYQSCPLFSPMGQFSSQSEATMTARASLIALLTDPQPAKAAAAEKPAGEPSLSRRRFLALR